MKTQQKKPGFGGQWVEIFSAGTHTDDAGNSHVIDAAFLEAVVSNFNLDQHEPPVVIGHPKTDGPAFGWGCALRRNGELLEAQLCDTDPQFEEMVRTAKFKKRSASFYMDAAKAPGGQVPALRHVGFLGAAPPAVKGLRDIHFEEGEATTFEFSEGATMKADEKDTNALIEKTIGEKVKEFFAKLGVGNGDAGKPANFSEADVKKLVEDSVKEVKTEFAETIKERDTKIEDLTKQVTAQGGSSRRAAIVQFCEKHSSKVLPALKAAGIVEFMETLDDTPANKKVTVISFTEKDGAAVEVKTEMSQLAWFQTHIESLPDFIAFGEKFGALTVTGDGSRIVDHSQEDTLRESMGVKKPEAAGAK